MLMNQITGSAPSAATSTQDAEPDAAGSSIAGRRRRRLLMAGAGVVAIGALVAGPAAADRLQTFIDHAPQSEAEADRMEVIYQGQSHSWAQISELQKHGKAMGTVYEPISYNKGQAHAFDTSAEADRWACANVPGLADRPICQTETSSPRRRPHEHMDRRDTSFSRTGLK
jgi:hypothetical protein